MIEVDISHIWGGLSLPDLLEVEKDIAAAHEKLTAGEAEFRPGCDDETAQRIARTADRIRRNSEVCVVVGAADLCRGIRGVLELVPPADREPGKPRQLRLLFAGDSLSTRSWNTLTAGLEGKDFSVIVISRFGTVPQNAIALRGLRWVLERRYGTEEAKTRIIVVTHPEAGVLGKQAALLGWEQFFLPHDMEERFALLSPAGLLPLAVAGLDIAALLRGAGDAARRYALRSFENPLWLYVGGRRALHRGGRAAETLVSPEPCVRAFARWWQQLFVPAGDCKMPGLIPVSGEFYGSPGSNAASLFETALCFDSREPEYAIVSDIDDADGMNALAGKSLALVQSHAVEALMETHADSGVPVTVIRCDGMDEEQVGDAVCFFVTAAGLSNLMLGGSPFGKPETAGDAQPSAGEETAVEDAAPGT